MTILERSAEQLRSMGNRPGWYYAVVVLIGFWMLFAFLGIVQPDYWLVNYYLTSPLLIGAVYMDRYRVRVTGSNRDYIETSQLLNRWVLGLGFKRGGIRISLLILFYVSQIPVVGLTLWYVASVRRRAFQAANPQEEKPTNKKTDEPATPRERVRMRIEEGRERIERAENLFEGGNYYEAHKEFADAVNYFERVLAIADDNNLDEERTEVDAIIRVCTRNANEAQRALYNIGDLDTELMSIEEFQAAERINVFFSYDSDDSSVVNTIKDGIEGRAQGEIDVYTYEDDLQPGESISRKAKSRIKEADIFLVLITQNSQNSAWVQQEVGFAEGRIQIVPILVEAPETPDLKGLLKGKEYLTFAPDSPNDFFENFMTYARETWDMGTEELC